MEYAHEFYMKIIKIDINQDKIFQKWLRYNKYQPTYVISC